MDHPNNFPHPEEFPAIYLYAKLCRQLTGFPCFDLIWPEILPRYWMWAMFLRPADACPHKHAVRQPLKLWSLKRKRYNCLYEVLFVNYIHKTFAINRLLNLTINKFRPARLFSILSGIKRNVGWRGLPWPFHIFSRCIRLIGRRGEFFRPFAFFRHLITAHAAI